MLFTFFFSLSGNIINIKLCTITSAEEDGKGKQTLYYKKSATVLRLAFFTFRSIEKCLGKVLTSTFVILNNMKKYSFAYR